MKKKILFIGILVFSLNCISQNKGATLYLRNGDTLRGLAKFTQGGVQFRYNKKSVKENFSDYEIKKIDIEEEGDNSITYRYKLVVNNQQMAIPMPMILIAKGKINLYRMTITNTNFGMFNKTQMVTTNTFKHYYVCRNNSDVVTRIAIVGTFLDKNFIKTASKYFSDCEDLVKKIKNRYYKKKNIEEVVNFYNRKCK
jgi:hypothetical protein